ncbi:DUF1534 domain-containing protein [Pseudomonas fluorescens]|nr:DUF1534 domain-containing protein [Pseudomonas fluorescens]
MRGNAYSDALRHTAKGRGASRAAFPRGAWERSARGGDRVQPKIFLKNACMSAQDFSSAALL